MRTSASAIAVAALVTAVMLPDALAAQEVRWPPSRAQAWYARQPWLVGANYVPRSAINQLETWQEAPFLPPPPRGLRARARGRLRPRRSRPGLGRVERAGRGQRRQLREAGAEGQGGSGGGAPAAGLRLGAVGPPVAAAHERRVGGRHVARW